ncbi:MAG: VTC domain-containing protein [Streptomyces sp.]|uniref:VTC domain-containing protein n=1 Tax=Streptomyces sp. TaxID=1931 RepID=UPI003D6BFD70
MSESALRALARASSAAPSVSLAHVMAYAPLPARFDRTYLVPATTFVDFFAHLTEPRGREYFRALTIGGRRCFGYHSVYYDTPALHIYRDHQQGRRQRFTVRERHYQDSGEREFQVRLKGSRGETVMHRTPLSASGPALGVGARHFLADTLRSAYGIDPPEGLVPALVTEYQRVTLVAEGQRVTCDAGLVCRTVAGTGSAVRGDDDLVLVGTRSTAHLTDVDRLLHDYGIRAAEFTPYAVLAVLWPTLVGNRWQRALGQTFPSPPEHFPAWMVR